MDAYWMPSFKPPKMQACIRYVVVQGMTQLEIEDEVATDLKRATGSLASTMENERKLNRMMQLTGFSDPVYAEV